MSVNCISAIGGGVNFASSPYAAPARNTHSTVQLGSGTTITTVRGSTGDVVAVTTSVVPATPGATQPNSSTLAITA